MSNPVVLTQSNRVVAGYGELVAPGYGKHCYTLSALDTTDFPPGGILEVEVAVGLGESDASVVSFGLCRRTGSFGVLRGRIPQARRLCYGDHGCRDFGRVLRGAAAVQCGDDF